MSGVQIPKQVNLGQLLGIHKKREHFYMYKTKLCMKVAMSSTAGTLNSTRLVDLYARPRILAHTVENLLDML